MDSVNANTVRSMDTSANGIGNERGAHLYIMQAGSGRIKVGRSGNPHKRRRSLETSGGEHISLVAVLSGQGSREFQFHAALNAARKYGEWFSGNAGVQRVLREMTGLALAFPFGEDGHLAKGARQARIAKRQIALDETVMQIVAQIMAAPSRRRRRAAYEAVMFPITQ